MLIWLLLLAAFTGLRTSAAAELTGGFFATWGQCIRTASITAIDVHARLVWRVIGMQQGVTAMLVALLLLAYCVIQFCEAVWQLLKTEAQRFRPKILPELKRQRALPGTKSLPADLASTQSATGCGICFDPVTPKEVRGDDPFGAVVELW